MNSSLYRVRKSTLSVYEFISHCSSRHPQWRVWLHLLNNLCPKPSLLQNKEPSGSPHIGHMLQPRNRLGDFSLDSGFSKSVLYQVTQNWLQYSRCGLSEEEQLLLLYWLLLIYQFAVDATHSAESGQPAAHQALECFPAVLLPWWAVASLDHCRQLVRPRYCTARSSFLHSKELLLAPLIRSCWLAALPLALLCVGPSADLMGVLCVSPPAHWEILKTANPRTDSWGTLLIHDLWVVFWTWEYCVEGFQEQKVTLILERLMKRM